MRRIRGVHRRVRRIGGRVRGTRERCSLGGTTRLRCNHLPRLRGRLRRRRTGMGTGSLSLIRRSIASSRVTGVISE